ncbi:MAG: ABC transporter ATP-binding protein [Chloroflexi bacterium]|nr:MAG: ABC transporter ATP-binding protein [Chloroflexota bacterium]MBL1197350.1 ABC transporter ATP-binding protein [Chloroflexota bacterium]NOH14647.1 ABC transporter ATP-binding protein [Chloroflexota bacterium]
MYGGGGWWRFLSADEDQKKPVLDRGLLARVFSYARPYWLSMIGVLVAITFISLVELIPPLLYRDLFDNVIPNRDFGRLNLLGVAMIAIPIISNLVGVGERYLSAKMGEGIIFDLRQTMYDHLQQMSLRFFTHTKSGEIISRFNSDVVGAQSAITGTLPSIVTNAVTLLTTLAVMLSIEWRLTLLSIAVLPLFLLPARRVGHLLRSIRREAMEYNADMSSMIGETLSINGALLVKTFGRLRQELKRFRETNAHVRDIGVRRAMVGRWFFMGLGISSTIGVAMVYWVGGNLVLNDAITAGTIVAFVAYLGRLYGPISSLSTVGVEFVTSMVSFERVFDYLDKEIEIADKPDATVLEEVRGAVRFENVSFNYLEGNEKLGIKLAQPNGDFHKKADEDTDEKKNGKDAVFVPTPTRSMALQDLNFEIEAGKLAALVGPSGAGKTTITYLLPRLYDPTEGRILLDDHDLRDMTQESLAQQIGMVTQETYLFHDTVRANLLYAKPDATDDELEAAALAANIYDFIASLPEGLDTLVGERGYRLSGGEKQRLAIARVILKDPRILILDEATSHLDSQSEALIQAALEPLMEGRTSLVIAHRLSTILAADKILVLEQGKLAEQGTHDELLVKGGLYANLFETQFRYDPERV